MTADREPPALDAAPTDAPPRIARAIRHWEGVIAGDGLTDADLLFAVKQLRRALRMQTCVCWA